MAAIEVAGKVQQMDLQMRTTIALHRRPLADIGYARHHPPIDQAADQIDAAQRRSTLATQVAAIDAEESRLRAEREAQRLAEEQAAAAREAFLREKGYDPATTDPREIGRQMAANRFGWGAGEFACYDEIIAKESRWDPRADNPTSSAYGIPQALPGRKMASAGADWKTNPATQIKWGLGYIKDRYGSPCQALSFRQGHDWY